MLWRKILHDLLAWLLLSALFINLLPSGLLVLSWGLALLIITMGLWWSVRLRLKQRKEQPQDAQALKLAQGADRIFSAFAYFLMLLTFIAVAVSLQIAWLIEHKGADVGEEALQAMLNMFLDPSSPLRATVDIYTMRLKPFALWILGLFIAFRIAALYFVQKAYEV